MREAFLVLFKNFRLSRVASEQDDLRFLCDLREEVEECRRARVVKLGEDLVEDHWRSVGGEEHR